MIAASPETSFAERFRYRDTPYLSPESIAEVFGVPVEKLLDGVKPDSPSTIAAVGLPPLQEFLQNLIRALAVATQITGEAGRAGILLRDEPLRAFDGKTAVELIREGRVDDVIGYLESFSGGAAG